MLSLFPSLGLALSLLLPPEISSVIATADPIVVRSSCYGGGDCLLFCPRHHPRMVMGGEVLTGTDARFLASREDVQEGEEVTSHSYAVCLTQ